ncbi:MAG: hypothetical protein ABJN62_19815, partial [Halioglobus sp.]
MAVETVEIIPLGTPELGMTRAEMLEYGSNMSGEAVTTVDTFYTLLFAYVIAMFIAGRLLTRMQYVIANIMYLLVMAITLFTHYQLIRLTNSWIAYAGIHSAFADEFLWGTSALYATLVILSIWFGRKIRH